MKDFILKLLSKKSDTSSRRFISVWSLILFTIVVLSVLFFHLTIPDLFIYALLSLIAGGSVLATFVNKK